MRLLCPHCRSELQMADHLAGQVQSCPRCQKPFRVPVPPPSASVTSPTGPTASAGVSGVQPSPIDAVADSAPADTGSPATSPPASIEPTQPVTMTPAPQISPYFPSPPSPTFPSATGPSVGIPTRAPTFILPQPVASPGYTKSIQLFVLRTSAVQIAQLLTLFALVVLLFCPWVKIPAETGTLAKQNGFQVAFGGADGEWISQDATAKGDGTSEKKKMTISASPTGIIYFFLVVISWMVGVLLAVGTYLDWPELRPYIRFRQLIMGGLSLFTAVMFLLQMLMGLPVVHAWTRINKPGTDTLEKVSKILQEYKVDWVKTIVKDISDAPGSQVGWSWGLQLSFMFTLILVTLVILDFWLQRRGSLMPPRLLLEK